MAENTSEKIIKIFQYGMELRAELSEINRIQSRRNGSVPCRAQRVYYDEVIDRIKTIESFWLLLNDEERFVIHAHHIEKLSWEQIVIIYENRWGRSYTKSERAMKYIQKRALQRIAKFIELHRHHYDYRWIDEI